ncbi:hypothetical protein [Motiliproteus sp. SC1-56]
MKGSLTVSAEDLGTGDGLSVQDGSLAIIRTASGAKLLLFNMPDTR